MANSTSKKIRNIALTLIGIAIFIGVYAYIGFDKILNVMQNRLSLLVIVYAVMLTFINMIIRAWRWDIILANFEQAKIRFIRLLGYTFAGGFLANITPGKIGELGKSYFLKRNHGISLRHGLPSIMIEKLADIIVTAGIAIFFIFSFIYKLNIFYTCIILLAYIILVIAGFLLTKLFSYKITNIGFIKRFMQKKNLEPKEVDYIFARMSGFGFISKTVILTFIIWIIGAWRLMIIGEALGIKLSFIYYIMIIAISLFVGGISLIPSGIGINDAVMIYLFNMMGGSLELYGAATLANTMLSVFLVNMIGGVLFIVLFGRVKKG